MRGQKLALLGGLKPIHWDLLDNFNGTLAAGDVNGTLCDSGQVRTFTDPTSLGSIAGGKLLVGPDGGYIGFGKPRLWHGESYARTPGRMLIFDITPTSASAAGYVIVGWGSASNALPSVLSSYGNQIYYNNGVLEVNVTLLVDGTIYKRVLIQRAAGGYFFQKTHTGNYMFLFANDLLNTTPLYPMFDCGGTAVEMSFLRIPQTLWLPVPLLSDGFGGTWPTLDGAGHAETTGIGSGGSGLTWTARLGTWGSAAGVASCSELDVSGIGIATATLNTADVWYSCVLGYSAGVAGVIVRYTDAANYVYAVNDGTNVKLFEVTTAVPYPGTQRGTGIKAPAAGARLIVDVSGAASRVYYNEALIFTYASIADTTGKTIGLITSNIGNTFNDAVAYAKGTGGEYSILDRYSRD